MPSDKSVRLEVRGLKELSAAFAAVDRDIPKELQVELKAVAEHVADTARGKMPYLSGVARAALRPRATGRGSAGIAFPKGGPGTGQEKDAYYPWLDFGGHVGRKHAIARDRVKGGRYLYPAIAESQDYIAEKVYDAVEHVARTHQFEVREG
jgi:hypothetical protein